MSEKKIDEEKLLLESRFLALVSMFSDSTMQHLGKIANPLTGKIERNLQTAKATIDILMMLKEKTKGNLSEREEKFLSNTISTLQLNYVEEVKADEAKKKEEAKKEKD
jgi:predicted nucleic acid-binding protein